MENRVDVSVIMPMYNAEKYIEHTISTLLNQKEHHQTIEIIIIDDVSTDHSRELVKGIKDERIKLIELSKNQGTANARNAGIRMAKGEWIQFVDSDDAICDDLYYKFEKAKKPGYNCYLFSLISEFHDRTLKQTIIQVTDKRAFGHFGGIWNKFIQRDICITFKEQYSFEDNCFIMDMMNEQDLKISLIEEAYYIYNRKNEHSKMAHFNTKEWSKMHAYLYDQIPKADSFTRMYLLEISLASIFDRSIPLKVSVPVAIKAVFRLLRYLPATVLSQNRHFIKNTQG